MFKKWSKKKNKKNIKKILLIYLRLINLKIIIVKFLMDNSINTIREILLIYSYPINKLNTIYINWSSNNKQKYKNHRINKIKIFQYLIKNLWTDETNQTHIFFMLILIYQFNYILIKTRIFIHIYHEGSIGQIKIRYTLIYPTLNYEHRSTNCSAINYSTSSTSYK